MSQLIADQPVTSADSGQACLDYYQCVEKIKGMAGLPVRKTKSIRESIRDNSFREAIEEAIHCRLMENWSLPEQIIFLESLSGLTDAEKRIRIYETAYTLSKIHRAIGGFR